MRLGQRRQRHAEQRRTHTGRGHGDEQFEVDIAEEYGVGDRRAPADHRDRRRDRRLHDREYGEHHDLCAHIGRRRQADRLLAAEDGTLADEVANGQRGAHEHRADIEHDQNLVGLSGIVAQRVRHAVSALAAHGEGQDADEERQQRQEHRVAAVGDDQPDLAARDRGELVEYVGVYRLAQVGSRAVVGRDSRRRRVYRSRHPAPPLPPFGGSQWSTACSAAPA